ncbi:restriction endonuclease subunit S, partial [Flavobacterium sp. AJR]|uniref:restriction endonuclease subunit S n=1 Tax=Flavobacterium sp. AJR TaxID=1979369 RepID=UPI000B763956
MKNWKNVKLGTLLTESKIVSDLPNTDKRIRVKLNILGIEKRPNTKDKNGATRYYTRKSGQFVYGKQNLHKGAFGIIPKELDGYESSLDIPAFDIDESCYPEWIFYFFKNNNFYLKLESLAKGVGSKRISPEKIYELEIPLPSKEEQRKILDEIIKVEAKNKELIKEIKLQEDSIVKLRQSILQDAIQGKLTKEWRSLNQTIKSANELFKHIQLEKEKLIKEGTIKREKLLPPISKNNIPFEIPEKWIWCSLGDILLKITDGTHHSPVNLNSGKYKYVTAKNIKNEGIQLDHITYITEDAHKEIYSRCNPQYGDILYIKDGATTGICCLNNLNEEFSMLSSVALLKSSNSFIDNSYLLYALRSPFYYDLIRSGMSGVAITRVTLKKLKTSFIPFPPLEEQKEIVKIINLFLLNCNNLEIESRESKKNSEKLMQTFLSQLVGINKNILNKNTVKKTKTISSRETKFNSKTILMDLVKLLQEN